MQIYLYSACLASHRKFKFRLVRASANMAKILIDETSSLIAAIFSVLIAILGTSCNLVTMIVILNRIKIRKHSTSPGIFYLALSDFIFSAICLPLQATRYFSRDWPFSQTSCEWFPLIFFGNVALSTFIMGFISINRAVHVYCSRLGQSLFTWKKSTLMVLGLCLFTFALLLPPVLGHWGKTGFQNETFSCTFIFEHVISFCLCFLLIMLTCLSFRVK